MEQLNFNELLLKTAFSCMACDGDIDKREVKLIKQLHKDKHIFGDIDINARLDDLLLDINKDGNQFLMDYLKELKVSNLSDSEELNLIQVAISTIKADDKVEYSEIKFFKVIRAKLSIDNDSILKLYPDFEEYLERDIISDSYLTRLKNDFFDTQTLPKFDTISKIDNILLDSPDGKKQ
ncbi:tellurite resistance TerB family protein [Labilibaculum euxinus]